MRADELAEHHRGIAEQRTAGGRDHFDLRQRFRIDPLHQFAEFQRLARRHGIAMHHMQRIAGLRHVQPEQRAPGAADGIKGAVRGRPSGTAQRTSASSAILSALFREFPGYVLQRQAAERQRYAALDFRAAHVDQFERAAAEVAGDAFGLDRCPRRRRAPQVRPRAGRTGRRS